MGKGGENFRNQFIPFLYQYFNIFQFATLPIISIFTYLFFKKTGFNYAENLVFNIFTAAQRHLMFILISPLMFIFNDAAPALNRVYILLWEIYFFWACFQFYRPKKKTWAFIKILVITLFFFTINTFLLLAVFYFFFFKKLPVQ
jgi:hypothetical protein